MSTDELQVLDLDVVRKARVIIRNESLINSSNVLYESLRQELKQLNTSIDDVDLVVNNALATVPVLLDVDELREYVNGLEDMGADSDRQPARDSYLQEIGRLLDYFSVRFTEVRKGVNAAIFVAETAAISGNGYMLSSLQSEREVLLNQVSPEEKPLIRMKEQMAVIDQAIKVYTDNSELDKALVLVDKVTSVLDKAEVPGGMKAAAIKAGAETAKMVLKTIDAAIKFEHLIKARTSLQESIDRRAKRMTSIEQQLDVNQKKSQQFIDSQNIVEPRRAYVYQVKKVADAFSDFYSAVFLNPKDVQGTAKLLLAKADSLKKYCQGLQPYWLRDV
ncbi:alpha-xenorhabdolysin family binary toxin subunit B [Pseudomonas carnis]|nr:alpha-xenorhabdolysin family binary toxin subunit B [Pseudomonas carnis]